jgi:serine/threonine protein phosphatase PrpC
LKSALLRGREHTALGEVAVQTQGSAAVALSRGGAAKVYAHTDPNEDAALFATGAGGTLLAVADAHGGCLAAEAAVERLLGHVAADWTAAGVVEPDHWQQWALAALVDVNGAIQRRAEGSETPRSCTTLSLALVRPREQQLLFATVGDSHCFQAWAGRVKDHGVRASRATRRKLGAYFLGWGEEDETSLAGKCLIGVEPLADTRAVVVATDGLSERHIGVSEPEGTVAASLDRAASAAADRRAQAAAREIVAAALEAQLRQEAGDNVACALVWLD